jgi:hypothetical protein
VEIGKEARRSISEAKYLEAKSKSLTILEVVVAVVLVLIVVEDGGEGSSLEGIVAKSEKGS